jgi:Uma2 family endonuclease
MATSVLIPLEQYLSTSYRPDREYIDGEVVERNMGKWEHARIQALLTMWFGQHEQQWGIQTATEWRTLVSQTRVRIPDVVLVRQGAQPDVLTDPPVLVVEILSPGDSYSDTQKRADDYLRMGVQTIWIVDPVTRTGRVCSGPNWVEAVRLEVAGTPIYVELDTLFASLQGSNP